MVILFAPTGTVQSRPASIQGEAVRGELGLGIKPLK